MIEKGKMRKKKGQMKLGKALAGSVSFVFYCVQLSPIW